MLNVLTEESPFTPQPPSKKKERKRGRPFQLKADEHFSSLARLLSKTNYNQLSAGSYRVALSHPADHRRRRDSVVP